MKTRFVIAPAAIRHAIGRFSRAMLAAAMLCAWAMLPTLPARADAYLVHAGDVLAVTVYGETGLSGEFVVSPDGTIGYPILGAVEVRGKTTTQITEILQQALSEHLPGVSVTTVVGQYAPVFVFGDVQNPGRYEFRPGMIALELVVLGGGARRSVAATANRQIQLIAAQHEYLDLELQIFAHEINRMRLEAEFDGRDFTAPDAAAPEPSVRSVQQSIIDAEAKLFAMRKAKLLSEQAALLAQEKSYDDEIRAIRESTVLHDEEIGLLVEDVTATRQLVERGLTSKSNLRETERRLSATRRDALELGSYLARAQQSVLGLERQRLMLVETRKNEAAAQLQVIELELARKRARQRSLADTMTELASTSNQPSVLPGERELTFTILRPAGDGYVETAAGERTPIKPGDIMKVALPDLSQSLATTVN